jgi:hypothetical protein
MRIITNALVVLSLIVALVAASLWVRGRDRIDAADYITHGRQVRFIWSPAVGVAWMRPTIPFRGWTLSTRAHTTPFEQQVQLWAANNVAGFNWAFGLHDPRTFGQVFVPYWFLVTVFLAYPAWRLRRRWRANREARRKGFEPVAA